jgi:hypothetical protein
MQKRGFNMNKKAMILISVIFVLILSNLANAVIFDIAAARQEEWNSYQKYKADYIQSNDLDAFSKYVSDCNLQNEFGFKPTSYYYISPSVLAAKYNPPLQGVVYSTENRGYTSSLNQPSAVQYYGEQINGRYTGYISSKLGSTYFDHPQINGGQNYLINSYRASTYSLNSNYYSTDYSSVYNDYNSYGYNEPTYAGTHFSGDNYGIYSNSGYESYASNYNYAYGYGNYQYLDAYDTNSGEPVSYARIVEPTTGGFYIIGYY